ncbi:MAG: hypothetical protein HFJ27_04610 [Clostridia bacterium]|nr:hypothetical protein [Clostridia bacterium]
MKKIGFVVPWNKWVLEEYNARRQRRRELWDALRSKLKEDWGKDFPTFDEMEPEVTTIKEMKAQLDTKQVSVIEWKSQFEKAERKEWVEELIAQHQDCSLIVVKSKYNPKQCVKEEFETRIAQKEEAVILLMGVMVKWIAFDPKKTYDIKKWAMNKMHSTVEFI